MRVKGNIAIGIALAVGCGCLSLAQEPAAGRQGGRSGKGGPAQTWWVEKTNVGVYVAPNKPLTKLADLKAKHAGTNNWKELVVKAPQAIAEYYSADAGTRYAPRLHPDTGNFMVVMSGEMHYDIEGQQPVVATRGSIVYIPRSTVFSYEVAGGQPAVWLDVNPAGAATLYPGSSPAPGPAGDGKMTRVAFNHMPDPYTGPNMPQWNLFEVVKAGATSGTRVVDDHLFAHPIYTIAGPNEPAHTIAPFDPGGSGHMHAGPGEFWLVMAGKVKATFENAGEFIAGEGDVLYSPPMTFHDPQPYGPGLSARLAVSSYRQMIHMDPTRQ